MSKIIANAAQLLTKAGISVVREKLSENGTFLLNSQGEFKLPVHEFVLKLDLWPSKKALFKAIQADLKATSQIPTVIKTVLDDKDAQHDFINSRTGNDYSVARHYKNIYQFLAYNVDVQIMKYAFKHFEQAGHDVSFPDCCFKPIAGAKHDMLEGYEEYQNIIHRYSFMVNQLSSENTVDVKTARLAMILENFLKLVSKFNTFSTFEKNLVLMIAKGIASFDTHYSDYILFYINPTIAKFLEPLCVQNTENAEYAAIVKGRYKHVIDSDGHALPIFNMFAQVAGYQLSFEDTFNVSSVFVTNMAGNNLNTVFKSAYLACIKATLRNRPGLDGSTYRLFLKYFEKRIERLDIENSSRATYTLIIQKIKDTLKQFENALEITTGKQKEYDKLLAEYKKLIEQDDFFGVAEKAMDLDTLKTELAKGSMTEADISEIVSSYPIPQKPYVQDSSNSEEIEELKHRLQMAEDRCAKYKDKLDGMSHEPSTNVAYIKPANVTYDEAIMKCVEGEATMPIIYRAINQMFPDVVFCEGIEEEMEKSIYSKPEKLFTNLVRLCGKYLPAILSGKSDTEARHVLGNVYRANESEIVMNSKTLSSQRIFKVGREKVMMDQHLTLGSRRGERYTIQVHFKIIDNVLHIGRIGSHLPVQSS